MDLLDALNEQNRAEWQAHSAGPTNESWDRLAKVYERRPSLTAELAFMENATAGALLRFLDATPEQQEAVSEAILMQGGMYDSSPKFVEVCA